MKKSVIVIIILLAILGIALYLSQMQEEVPSNPAPAPSPSESQSSPPVPPAPAPAPVISPGTVVYANEGFAPAELTVKKGTAVTFLNDSVFQMWPASAVHPTHAAYPVKGGCIGSTFDACKGIEPGASWTFTFNAVGRWQYHDHLSSAKRGTIIVE